MVHIPLRRVNLLQAVLYTLGGIALAWGLSIVVEGSALDRWKVTALVATVLAGSVLFVVAFFLQYYEP
jgi:hypothetical protein